MISPPPIKLLSYADDLEVFLTAPQEWPILLRLLNLYHQASNAKVNLMKTVVMSLSGESHTEWKSLALEYGAQWHDANSNTALQYLGYPLFHNNAQLLDFLDTVKIKIATHANILKSRRLSLRGASMVANSLLLSRLWHILRVTIVPSTWLHDIKRLVREFLLPFWPKPAWDTLCLPRSNGGVGLIDIEAQNHALHFIYLQRLCRPLKKTDFLTPWIVRYYYLLTGHHSILPWFLFPKHFKPRLKADDNMHHLCSLLQKLPPLSLSSTWSPRWLLDLPIRITLPSQHDNSTLPIRYLLSDILHWEQDQQCFVFHKHNLPRILQNLIHTFPQENLGTPFSLPLNDGMHITIQDHIITGSLPTNPPPLHRFWLPSLSHWTTPVSTDKPEPIPSLTLTQLRRLWHPQHQFILNRPHPPLCPRPFCLIYNPSFWKRFWKLSLPHKAFTPWWRLLHEKVSTRKTLYTKGLHDVDSPLCGICKIETEDHYHLFVGCSSKRRFWFNATEIMQISSFMPIQSAIWCAITTFQQPNGTYLQDHVLQRLGCILSVVWQLHWRCMIAQEQWSTEVAIGLLKSNHLFSSLIPKDISDD